MQKTPTATINGVAIPVVIDNRALVEYKRLKGKNGCDDLEEVLLLNWFGIRSGARRAGVEFKMDFEAFIDYTSDHPDYLTGIEVNEPEADNPEVEKKNMM